MLHIICGAPCSGKTTYAKMKAKAGEIIVDADAIAYALGAPERHLAKGDVLEVALAARKTAINEAIRKNAECWIIDSSPSVEAEKLYKEHDADFVLMDVSEEECIERAKRSGRPEETINIIHQFFNKNKDKMLFKEKRGKHMPDFKPITTQEEFETAIKERMTKEMKDYEKLKAANKELLQRLNESAGQPDQLKEAADSIKRLEAELNSMKAAETTRTMREKVSAEKRIPANLLTGDTEEACAAQADAILSFAKSNGSGYPAPRDGGEIGKAAVLSPRDQFAEWAKDNF